MIIVLTADEINWAHQTAKKSLAKWQDKAGYYNNRFNSHFKGKLGEIAVEKFLISENIAVIPHFRFPEREELCDIQIADKNLDFRIEVKTWSLDHWPELGRCIAVEQLPTLEKKTDRVLWCIVEVAGDGSLPTNLCVELAGWSTLSDIKNASIKMTGTGKMRKVRNHQLEIQDLRAMENFFTP